MTKYRLFLVSLLLPPKSLSSLRLARPAATVENTSPIGQMIAAGNTKWTVMIYFARHGQSCANAMQDLGKIGQGKKNFYPDPVLTDCGVRRSIQAGEAFAEWAWEGVNITKKGVKVDGKKLSKQHYGDDLHKGLDLIGSSRLFRAIETSIFQFGRMSPPHYPKIVAMPYISEKTKTADNTANAAADQKRLLDILTRTTPPGAGSEVGTFGFGRLGVDWGVFEIDNRWDEEPHWLNGELMDAGDGRDESNIDKFYSFLSENVLPELAVVRMQDENNKLNVLRLGIVSHSSFLFDMFKRLCNLDVKPWNNDILAIPYDFTIDAEGKPSLTVKGQGDVELADFCSPEEAPISRENRDERYRLSGFPKHLCAAEIQRCEKQVDLDSITFMRSRMNTGLPKAAEGHECECMI